MKIGANYLTEKRNEQTVSTFDKVYEILIKKGYLDVLKYPGKYCDYSSLNSLLDLARKTDCEIDMHGLPGMIPATHDKNMMNNIKWEELSDLLWKNQSFKRYSTHIGLDSIDQVLNYEKEEFETNFKTNFEKFKQKLKEMTGREIQFGGENQPGGFGIDKNTLTPEFISSIWSKMDFGVFDIAHAKSASADLGISYEEYLNRLMFLEKVNILHIASNIDQTGKYPDKPDKHLMIAEDDLEDILKTIEKFPNLDLIVTEHAYNSKYSYEKEIVIEIVTLNKLVKTKNIEETKHVMNILEKELKENLENIEEVLEKIGE